MSTASGETSSDQPQRTSHQPGPLTVLAASAIGGVIASRMGKTPLVLVLGAAALALLKQKKPTSSPQALPQSPPPPAPPPEIPAQSQVEQWLSRQIIREEQAPPVEFSTADVSPFELEDDYRPQSFLLDDADAVAAIASPNDAFARLTEPVPLLIPEPAPPMEMEQGAPLRPPQVLETPQPAAPDATWTLGVEPLPSLNDASPFGAVASSMFFTAPVRQEAPEPQPVFSTPVFQGAAFPDEVQVASSFEPAPSPSAPYSPEELASALEPEPQNEPPPAEEAPPEILVQLAAPGDASFDPPLAAAPQNPWQTEADTPATTPASLLQSHATSPMVEAEIILRPRAPMQSFVTAKSKFAPPGFDKNAPLESSNAPPADAAADAPFPNPLQTPREPRPRPTWRSWWRGD